MDALHVPRALGASCRCERASRRSPRRPTSPDGGRRCRCRIYRRAFTAGLVDAVGCWEQNTTFIHYIKPNPVFFWG